MISTSYIKLILIGLLFFVGTSCEEKSKPIEENDNSNVENVNSFKATLDKHLVAVANKNSVALKSTMSPKGNMELIQPASEIVYSVEGFMKFHQEWFNVPNWTVETKVLSTTIGDKVGVATTEFLYKEPERNGKPYFNRLIVTYTLEKINNNWYIIKDHASSVEKTKS